MTTASLQHERTIRATIDQSAISRVSSFFNATAEDILNEALQNSRRSQATAVHITTHETDVTIADDGAGIADPQAILSFGRTDWTDAETQAEQPAGMGMYALARLDPVTIKSKIAGQPAWSVELMPKHFTGEESAAVVDADDAGFPSGHGTIISFEWRQPVDKDIEKATQYYPIPVRHNDAPLPQQDFLAGAERITEWEGLRIGVFMSTGFLQPPMTGRVNFHGVHTWGNQVKQLVPTMSPHRMYDVRVDVVECPQLELTLPARKQLVKTPFVEQLKRVALQNIYTAIAESPDRPGVTRERQLEAAGMGIAIPDPKASLPQWKPTDRSDDEVEHYRRWLPTDPQCLIVSEDLNIPEEHTLAAATENTEGAPQLFHAQDDELAGYGWYDAIPRITGISTSLRYGDAVVEMTDKFDQLPGQRPDEIRVRARIREADGSESELEMTSPIAFPNDEDTFLGDLTPLITKDSDLTSRQVRDLLMLAYFQYSEEYDSDSHDTQKEWAEETIFRNMQALLESRERAVENAVRNAVFDTGIHSMPVGTKMTITVQEDGHIFTQLEVPEDPPPADE